MGNICDAHRLRGFFFLYIWVGKDFYDGDCWEKQEKGGLSMNGPITVLLDCISFLIFLKGFYDYFSKILSKAGSLIFTLP